MTNLPANRNDTWTLSLPEQEARADHRTWIGGRVVTLLSHYWREDDPVDLTAAIGADWADVLEGMPHDAIQKACVRYQRDEPRRKPTPGAIYQLAREMMPRPAVVPQPPVAAVERDRCDPAIAQAICEAAGYAPKKFGGHDGV